MAKHKHERTRGEHSKKVKLAVLIAGIIILLGVIATILALQSNKAAKDAKGDAATSVRDLRSAETKQANQQANQQALNGDTAAATKTIDAALAGTPQSDIAAKTNLYQQKATVLANAGQKDAAVASLNEAIKLNPNDWRLHENLGNMYAYLGDTANALPEFEKADKLLAKSPVSTDYNDYHARIAAKIASSKAGNN